MDFYSLLAMAQQNVMQQNPESSKFYHAKFTSPKKERKVQPNVKKFLEKREKEQRQHFIAKQKRDELVDAAKNKMKKRKIKKSNLIDYEYTATIQFEQPDEDDYGFTSQEASQCYQNLIDKYKNEQEEQMRIVDNPAKCVQDGPHRQTDNAKRTQRRRYVNKQESKRHKEKQIKCEDERANNRLQSSDLSFNRLLNLAQKKQFEPVVVEVKQNEDQRLLAKKQKRELEEQQRYLADREERDKNRSRGLMPNDSEAKLLLTMKKKLEIEERQRCLAKRRRQIRLREDVTRSSAQGSSNHSQARKVRCTPAAQNVHNHIQVKRLQTGDSKKPREIHSQSKDNRDFESGAVLQKLKSTTLPSSFTPVTETLRNYKQDKRLQGGDSKKPFYSQSKDNRDRISDSKLRKLIPTTVPSSSSSQSRQIPTKTSFQKPTISNESIKSTSVYRSVLAVEGEFVLNKHNSNTKAQPFHVPDMKTAHFPLSGHPESIKKSENDNEYDSDANDLVIDEDAED